MRSFFSFFFNDTATPQIYTLSLHDALPISSFPPSSGSARRIGSPMPAARSSASPARSEEHTSELQSPDHLVCRLLLEKKKHAENRQRLQIAQSRARAQKILHD